MNRVIPYFLEAFIVNNYEKRNMTSSLDSKSVTEMVEDLGIDPGIPEN